MEQRTRARDDITPLCADIRHRVSVQMPRLAEDVRVDSDASDRGGYTHVCGGGNGHAAGWARMRRVRENGIFVDASANVSDLRRDALLQLVSHRHASKHAHTIASPRSPLLERVQTGCTATRTMCSPSNDLFSGTRDMELSGILLKRSVSAEFGQTIVY